MGQKPSKTIISVAWPYANGDLHLGHPAGYLLGAGILNDFFRLQGVDVIMVSGSDMHGTPVAVSAWKKGIKPEDFARSQHKSHMEVMKTLDLKYSLYTSTATKIHEQIVQRLFRRLFEKGYIFSKQTEQFWSEIEHKFLLDRYIEGECPYCGYDGARGDQCDNCGKTLTPDDLKNPYSIFGDKELKKRASTNYFLDLAKLQKLLEKHYKNHEGLKEWRKHVWATAKAWLDEGLEPRAITRDMEGYGVHLPVGYEVEKEEGKVIYVWFEAVCGYLTASIELSIRNNKFSDAGLFADLDLEIEKDDLFISDVYKGQSLDWTDYWLNEDVHSYYFMGKDNIPFHAIIWPAMLLGFSEGDKKKLNLPWNIPANQYLNLKGGKFSKSKGNVIDSKYFFETYGQAAVRHYLISRMPENKDYDFTWEEFVEANNNELVANLGNLVNRTLVFWNKSFGKNGLNGDYKVEKEVSDRIKEASGQVSEALWQCKFGDAYQLVMELSSFGNKYFNDSQIWQVVKTDSKKAEEIMFNLLQIVANLALIIRPFLPEFSDQILTYLGIDKPEISVGKNNWQPIIFETDKLKEIADLLPLIKKLELEQVLIQEGE